MTLVDFVRTRRPSSPPDSSEPADGAVPPRRPEEVLTGPGGLLEIPADERRHVLIHGDGRLLVTEEYRDSPRIESLAARLRRTLGVAPTIEIASVAHIAKAYAIADDQRSNVDETQTRIDLRALIETAASFRATDIRIRSRQYDADIYFRVNGSMVLHKELSAALGEALNVVAFNVGQGDASYSRMNYQATRITRKSFELPESVDALRLQYSPLENGGRLCATRLLYHVSGTAVSIDDLGYTAQQQETLEAIRQQPSGVVLICGPTGSGKSTTLYATLETLNRETGGELNIISIEDPIERTITGVTQIPITNVNSEEERQVQFHKAIISALRSDPDGLMIGEIRDEESARLAFVATMTGHFVYTTLHTNDAMAAIPRLREIGVAPYLLFDSHNIVGIVAQRLVRSLCPHCKIPLLSALRHGNISQALFKRATSVLDLHRFRLFHRGPGCVHCRRTGYIGPTVIAEIIRPDDEFMNLLAEHKTNDARRLWLRRGGRTMAMHALDHLLAGRIDLTEFEQEAGNIAEAREALSILTTDSQIRNAS